MFSGNTPSGTLAYQVKPRSGILAHPAVYSLFLILGGSLFVALCAQIRIPLPFTPVPITLQTLGILLVGSLLGSRQGLLSMLLYLALGLVGLPFFSGGQAGVEILHGPTVGYLVAAPLAAMLVGWLAERGWDQRVGTTALSMILGNLVIYALGVAWLSTLIGLEAAITKGALPFILGDLVKIAVACVVLPGGWRLLGRGVRS